MFTALAISPAKSAGSTLVTDGDTVAIRGERIRIADIDAPEIHHAQCDAERRPVLVAKRRLQSLLGSGRIVITRGRKVVRIERPSYCLYFQ